MNQVMATADPCQFDCSIAITALRDIIYAKYSNDVKLKRAADKLISNCESLLVQNRCLEKQLEQITKVMEKPNLDLNQKIDTLTKENLNLSNQKSSMDIEKKSWEFMIGVRSTIESRECEMFPEWISLLELSHGQKFLLALTFNVSVFAFDMKKRLTATGISLQSYCEKIDEVYCKYSSNIHGTEIENEMSDEQWTNFFESLKVRSNLSKQCIKVLIEPYSFHMTGTQRQLLPIVQKCCELIFYLDNVNYKTRIDLIEETLKENGVRHVCVVKLPKPGHRNLFSKKVFIGVKHEDREVTQKLLREPKVVRAFSFPGEHFLIMDTYTVVKRANI